jgi:hypothetical protein
MISAITIIPLLFLRPRDNQTKSLFRVCKLFFKVEVKYSNAVSIASSTLTALLMSQIMG